MQVNLAGFNTDISQFGHRDKAGLTPETICAAYARISRRPEPIPELRAQALMDVAAARSSNERIVFGLGHASIAEHAVFNFDVLGVSRLVLEAIEARRLASFTEKSQRYVKMTHDYLIPQEVTGTAFEPRFRKVSDDLFIAYGELLEHIAHHYMETGMAKDQKIARHKAREDARYVLPLATLAQVGMTVNARTLEYMIKALAASQLKEAQELSRAVYEPAFEVAPSLIRYITPSVYDRRIRNADFPVLSMDNSPEDTDVHLLDYTDNGDLMILTALIQRVTGSPVTPDRIKTLPKSTLKTWILSILQDIRAFDPVPREFEHAVITFQAVISSSAFAQLKRHRMVSLTPGPYSPDLGRTIPPVIKDAGAEDVLNRAVDASESAWQAMQPLGRAADYMLTNAARRTVIGTMNLREAYHLSRLRMDSHAQWDIRRFSTGLIRQISDVFPVSGMLLSGKDHFDEIYNRIFSKN